VCILGPISLPQVSTRPVTIESLVQLGSFEGGEPKNIIVSGRKVILGVAMNYFPINFWRKMDRLRLTFGADFNPPSDRKTRCHRMFGADGYF